MRAPGRGRKLLHGALAVFVGLTAFVIVMVGWMQMGIHVFDKSEAEISDSPGYWILPAIFSSAVMSLTYNWLRRRDLRRGSRSDG